MDPATHEIPGMKCGSCGYSLEGLAWDGRCPECGLDIARSVTPIHRGPVPGRYTHRLALGFLAMAAGNAAGVAGLAAAAAMAASERRDDRAELVFWTAVIASTSANGVAWTLASAEEDRAWRKAPGRRLAQTTAALNWIALFCQCVLVVRADHSGRSDTALMLILIVYLAHAVKAGTGLLALGRIGRQFEGVPRSPELPIALAWFLAILLAVMYPPLIATGWAVLALMQAALARRLLKFNRRAPE